MSESNLTTAPIPAATPPAPASAGDPAAFAQAAPASAPSSVSGPNWQEQDMQLRELWFQNKTPQEISEILNRSTAAIMTRAARLGLPRRAAPGRKPGGRRLREDGSLASTTIQRAPRQAAAAEKPVIQTSTRICLMCLRQFTSQGRHNRICSACKGTPEYSTASALPDIHLPG